MKSNISIGANIYHLRKEVRLTQDDLASFLGVTKASVSKWETGQSYPDIELLPKIATYFGTTVDALIGYAPQMTKDGIKRACERLRMAFATETFEKAHAQCRELVRDYYSCYPLLAQIASLYLNHANLVAEDRQGEFAGEALELCHRVRRNSESSSDVKLAEAVEASFLLLCGNPQAAVELLAAAQEVDAGIDVLLANAYCALGQTDEADEVLQAALFQSIVLSVNRLAQLAVLYAGNPEKIDVTHVRTLALIEAFDLETVYVNVAAIHLCFAMAYAMADDSRRALDCLEDYERSCRTLEFPIVLHGDSFFDKIESWIEKTIATGTSAPRDEALVRQSIVEDVVGNSLFASLADDSRFKRIVKSLEEVAR